MKSKLFFIVMLLTVNMLVGCAEDPPSSTPSNPQPDTEMGSDMQPDLADADGNKDTDSDPDVAQSGRLVIQPVSGSGVVKGAKFRAHIQVGRLVDVSPGK